MADLTFEALHFLDPTPTLVRVGVDRPSRTIESVEWLWDVEASWRDRPIVAPALWDIQHNGRGGVSFSDPNLTVEQVRVIARSLPDEAVGRFCPTLITASVEATLHGVRTIAAACESDPLVDALVLGIHLEGPAISQLDGYRGAHPVEHVRDADWSEFERLQEASGGRIALVTLAPERAGSIAFIRRATEAGVAIALGHTAADGATLDAAVEAGARISTHLGNGIATPLPRHPNAIWHQAGDDRLFASFIGDLQHLDLRTLTSLYRAKGPALYIFVSDLSPLAGCSPGSYGPWEVREDGRIVVAGTEYLAGANRSLVECLGLLAAQTWSHRGWHFHDLLGAATVNPARALRRPIPTICVGMPANIVLFDYEPGGAGLRPIASLIEGEGRGEWVR